MTRETFDHSSPKYLGFGMLCVAPRGAGWAGENHPHCRRERGAVIAIDHTGPHHNPYAYRVQFRDGTAHWFPVHALGFSAPCSAGPNAAYFAAAEMAPTITRSEEGGAS